MDKYARQKVIGESDVRIGDVDLNVPIKLWINLRDLDEVGNYFLSAPNCSFTQNYMYTYVYTCVYIFVCTLTPQFATPLTTDKSRKL